jgi:CRP-like cAMP-binding protein
MKKKVLLIEDDHLLRENTTEILELASYDVTAAENGKVGVARAKEIQPDLIICDIVMPELDGYGVLYLLNKDFKTSAIPFIFLSAKAEKSAMRKGMALGADDYLTKPFEEIDLLNAVEVRLKRSQVFKQEFSNDIAGVDNFMNEARGLKELERLSRDSQIRNFKKKDTIFYEGDYPNVLFFLNKGKVKTIKINEDGKEYITGLITEGEFFGYMPILKKSAYTDIAIAMEDAEVYRIPIDDFTSLMQCNRDVANKFIKMISNNLTEKEEMLLSLAYDTVRKRVANTLMKLKDCYQTEDKSSFKINISRNDLASLVGTASESVIRTLADFKEEKLIRVEGKDIVVLNEQGLEKIW